MSAAPSRLVLVRRLLLLCGALYAVRLPAQAPAITVPPLSKVVIAGQAVSFAVTATGAGPLTYQWKHHGQAIAGATNATLSLPTVRFDDSGWYQVVVGNAAGSVASVFMLNVAPIRSNVLAWGRDDNGPANVPANLGGVLAVAAGPTHFLALKADGKVAAWGGNTYGQLDVPADLSNVVGLAAGDGQSLALKADGTIVAWGMSYYNVNTVPAGLDKVVMVAAGARHNLALRADGTVVAWGEVGAADLSLVAGLSDIVAISTEATHSLALRSNGTVAAWGWNDYGQTTAPVGPVNAVAIAAGGYHSVLLRTDGTVGVWGYNGAGVLNLPDGLAEVVGIASGGNHVVALRRDRTLVAWGSSYQEALNIPVGLRNCAAVSANGAHTMALVERTDITFSNQPSDQMIAAGGNVTLTVTASGSPPLNYQWRKDGNALVNGGRISGANTPTLSINGAQVSDSGVYTVVVSNGTGSVLATPAAVGVTGLPAIVVGPASQVVVAGAKATFSLKAASASPLSYQWRKNGAALANGGTISGATTATLAIAGVAVADAGDYSVVVSNSAGDVASGNATLTVAVPPTLVRRPMSRLAGVGQSVTFTVEATSTGPIHYAWKRRGQVIAGATAATLPIPSVAWSDQGYYDVVVSNAEASVSSRFCLNVSPLAVTSPRVMMWFSNGVNYELALPAGFGDVVSIAAAGGRSAALNAGGVFWGPATTPPAGLSEVIAFSHSGNIAAALRADGTVQAWGYSGYDATSVPPGLGDVVAVATGAYHGLALQASGRVVGWGKGGSGGVPPLGLENVTAIAAGENHCLALKSDGTVVAWGVNGYGETAVPAGLTNVVAIGGGRCSAALRADGTVVAWGGNFGASTISAVGENIVRLSVGDLSWLGVTSGGAVIAGDAGKQAMVPAALKRAVAVAASGTMDLALVNAAAATIVTQPATQLASIGDDVALAVNADGMPFPTYQWRKNGVLLTGATTATLTLTSVQAANAGTYSVVVSNEFGPVTSNAAVLTVVPPATIGARPLSRRVLVGEATAFTVVPGDAGTNTFQWKHNGQVISGATAATLTVASVTLADEGFYEVRVTNQNGGTARSYCRLHVAPRYGTVVAWGSNSIGQCSVPSGMGDVVSVVAARSRSLALRANGSVVVWGLTGPAPPSGLANVVALACSSAHALALKNDGTVVAWGLNNAGQLDVPAGLNEVIAVGAGSTSSIALKADGTLVGWGTSSSGLPPLKNNVALAVREDNGLFMLRADGRVVGAYDVPAAALSDVVAVAAGDDHKLALRRDGSLVSWGGSWANVNTIPAAATNLRAMAGGYYFTTALRWDGTVVMWGLMGGMQTYVPAGLANVTAVAAGTDHTLALVTAEPPTLSTQPVSQISVPGGWADFSVAATGYGSITYQWLLNGKPLAGATTTSLRVTNLQLSQVGAYSVAVTNVFGTTISSEARLTGPNPLPVISSAPQSARLTAGQNATLSVAATGLGALGYQWRRNGVALAGATNAALNLGSATSALNGSYDVMINDGLSLTISSPATLTVVPTSYPQVVRPDPACAAAFEVGGGYPGGFQRLAGGKVIVFGSFSRLNGTALRNVARLNADASVDVTFTGAYFNGSVYAAVAQPDGKLVVGGVFTEVDGQSRNGLARLNADGTLDASFWSPGNFYGVFALALQADGKVVLGGGFTSPLARVNADGSTDATFAPAPNGVINALAVQADGKIVAGGGFTTIAAASRSGLARLNPDGTIDSTFAVGSGLNADVYAVRALSGGRVLAAGAFTTYNGATAGRIVRLSSSGAIDAGWSVGSGFNYDVYTLELQADGRILAGGAFGGFNGVQRTAIARLNPDGPLDTTFAPLTFQQAVIAITYLDDGTVLVGGGFSTLAGSTRLGLARLSGTGASLLGGFSPGLLSPSTVNRAVAAPGGKVIAAGAFTYVNGNSQPGLVRLSANGAIDPTFSFGGVGPNGAVNDVLVLPDGKLLVTGPFTSFNTNTTYGRLVRLTADGAVDGTFARNFNLAAAPTRMYARPTGAVLLLGSEIFSGTPAKSVMSIDANASLDSSFTLGAPGGGAAMAAAIQSDDKIVLAGSFTDYNGTPRERIVRLLPDGSVDTGYIARVDGTVNSVALQPDGKLVIAGDFVAVNDVPRARLARLQSDGAVDSSFVPAVSLNAAPSLVTLQPDGRMLVAGGFSSVTNYPAARYLIRVGATGTLDTTLCAPGLSGPPADVLMVDDGSLLLAGGTMRVGGSWRVGVIKTLSTAGPEILTPPLGGTTLAGTAFSVSVTVAGGQDLAYQWYRSGSALPGATNSTLTVTSAQAADTGAYSARITHAGGSVDSTAANVTITPSAPVLSSSSGTISGFGGAIRAGSHWLLTAPSLFAGTEPISYQWSRNGTAIPGATTRLYFPATWQPSDAGVYAVTISNAVGSVSAPNFQQLVTPSVDWDWRAPLPQGNSLLEAVFLNGRFLAGGSRGTLLTSTDGLAWTVARLGVSDTIFGFAFGNGTHVALSGYSGVWSSADALTWTRRASGVGDDGSMLMAVAYGAGRFVAVGGGGTIATSADGKAWQAASSGTGDALGAIAWGNDKFIALGTAGRTFISADGLAWSAGPVLPRSVGSIAFGSGRFVAAGGTHLYVSTDGAAWTHQSLAATASIASLQFTAAGFLATLDSTEGRYWRSLDGVTWSEQVMGQTFASQMNALTFGAGRYVMVGYAPETLLTSANGSTWTRAGATTALNFVAAAAGDTAMVAVTSNSHVRMGADGTMSSLDAGVTLFTDVRDVAFGGGRYVAVGGTGGARTATSTNGSTWTLPSLGAVADLYGVSFLVDRFFAFGATGTLLTSLDGAAWSTRTSGTTQTLRKGAYGAGTYVVVGAAGTVLTSTDGMAWTPRSVSGVTSTINDVIFAAGQFVLVSEGASIRTSPDGITWTARTNPLGAGLKSVVYGGGRFWAFTTGNTNYLVSADGVTWTAAQHGNANTTGDAVVFGDKIYLVGANTSIVSLPLNAVAPVIATPPAAQTVALAGTATLSVNATGTGPFIYQWFKNGAAILGANSATLVLGSVSRADAGEYTVTITNAAGSVTSTAATLTVNERGLIASQVQVATVAPLRGAFTIEGAVPKQMLVRAVGPTLANFGVSGFVADPTVSIASAASETELVANNDWETAANAALVASVTAQLGVYPLVPGSKDAAVLATLAPGTYRVNVGPVAAGGTVSLEIYDADANPRLVYIATQAHVGAAGFTHGFSVFAAVAGRSYLIRALGPSLGVSGALGDPQLAVFSGATQVAANDNWGGGAVLVALGNSVGAMPIPLVNKDAALKFEPAAAGVYTVRVSGVGGATGTALLEIFEADAQRAATVPLAIVSPPASVTVDAGQPASLGVVVVGKPAPAFQWRRDGTAISEAVSSVLTIPRAQVSDAGSYVVRVTNGGAGLVEATATLAVTATNNAQHALADRGYTAGGTVSIANTLYYAGTPASLGWSVELPAGWSFASDAGAAGAVKPAAGATGTIAWTWNTLPASPVVFTYTLNVPVGETAARTLAATALVGSTSVAVAPSPLTVGVVPPYHSADTDGNYRLSLLELTRVIELYNTRYSTTRSGCYAVPATVTEDGFAPEPARASSTVIALARYHAADSNRDGKLSLLELTRVIELYNTRSGATRSGQYHAQAGTEDGFAPGP